MLTGCLVGEKKRKKVKETSGVKVGVKLGVEVEEVGEGKEKEYNGKGRIFG